VVVGSSRELDCRRKSLIGISAELECVDRMVDPVRPELVDCGVYTFRDDGAYTISDAGGGAVVWGGISTDRNSSV
jgi:hypothetical protein